MATVLGSCPFLPRFLGCHGGGNRCTAFTTARVNRAMKLRFTWFATVGFIRCFAHPIQRKIELYLLVIYFGMKPLFRATSRNDLGIKDPSRHFIYFSTLFGEKNDSSVAARGQA